MFEFQSWLRGLSAEVLVVDLSELSYMDSAGLGLSMNGYVSAENKGHKFLLACVSERVSALLQMTGVDQVLKPFPTVQSAMDSIGTLARDRARFARDQGRNDVVTLEENAGLCPRLTRGQGSTSGWETIREKQTIRVCWFNL